MSAPATLLVEGAVDAMLELAYRTPVHGVIVEVGVYKGGSAWYLAQLASKRQVELHLFDTFSGIPEKSSIDTHDIGDFGDTHLKDVVEALKDVADLVEYHVGVFPFTIPPEWFGCDPFISFIHADADQHATTATIARMAKNLLLPGGIVLFDDYGCLDGATRAVNEAFNVEIQLTPQGKAYWVKP